MYLQKKQIKRQDMKLKNIITNSKSGFKSGLSFIWNFTRQDKTLKNVITNSKSGFKSGLSFIFWTVTCFLVHNLKNGRLTINFAYFS